MWARALLVVAIVATHANADQPAPRPDDTCDFDCRIERIRGMLERGDRLAARRELIALYDETRRPELLFALGQVELQLGDYQQAIEFYERFIATNPGDDQIAIAQQAIGAARMKITQPKPTTIRYERRWDRIDTVIAAVGGAAIAVGGGVMFRANQLGNDASGTLGDYADRQDRARTYRIAGASATAAGAIALGIALVRWRFDHSELVVDPAARGATVTVGVKW